MTRGTALLTNGAYINSELAAEFGPIPPSFLPFGHGRLLEKQISRLQSVSDRIIITLPATFQPDNWDLSYLFKHGVEIVKVNDRMTLGESVSYAIAVAKVIGPVRILHGDTYFPASCLEDLDVVSISTSNDAYQWGVIDESAQRFHTDRPPAGQASSTILTGWFAFSSAEDFARALIISRGDFLESLSIYSESFELRQIAFDDWIDFGHLQTYYRGRAQVNTARSFNSIKFKDRSATKSGAKSFKIAAEANWFETIPGPIRLFTPAFLGRTSTEYTIAYEPNPTLHEIYMFGRLEPSAWRNIAAACFDFLETCRNESGPTIDNALKTLSFGKTNARLAMWSEQAGIDLTVEWRTHGRRLPSLLSIMEATAAVGSAGPPISGVMHGDFCFPNIFYDFRHRCVRVIDPRGSIDDTQMTVFGDLQYDLAKLNHSLEGYDLILSGRYNLSSNSTYDLSIDISFDNSMGLLSKIMSEFTLSGLCISDDVIKALTVHLFLSMLPLHGDRPDRQRAFLANALRLAAQMEIFQ